MLVWSPKIKGFFPPYTNACTFSVNGGSGQFIRNVNTVKKLALGLFLLAAWSLHGQRGWEAGAWGGVSYYFGDLNTNYYLGMPNLAAGVMGRFNFNERVCFKMGASFGRIEASDAVSKNIYEQARNLSFRSQIIEGSAEFEFNFLPYIHGSRDAFFTPYLFAGIAIFSFNPEAEYQGRWVELRPLGTEGQFKGEEYFAVQPALSYGGGFKFDLNAAWSVNLEISARNASTDYLDDVSTVYPDKRDLGRARGDLAVALSDRSIDVPGVNDSQLGQAGTQRGNSKNKDMYVFAKVGIVRYFGSLRCPSAGGSRR